MDAKLGERLTMYQTLLYGCLVCVVSLTGGVVDASEASVCRYQASDTRCTMSVLSL